MARWIKRAILRASFFSTYWSGSKFLTSAPIWQANCDTSKLTMRSTPLVPASSAFHTSSALLPTPHISPTPVTTTRRAKLLSFRVGVDVVDRVFHGADLLCLLVGDFDVEGLFECHNQFDRVQRVGAEVVYKRCIGCNLALVYAELLHNDLLYAFFYGCHEFCKLLFASPPPAANSTATSPACCNELRLCLRVRLDIRNRVLNRADLLRFLVGDLHVEGLLESHDQLNRVQRVGPKIVDKRRFGGYFRLVHAKLLHDNLLYALFYGCHEFVLLLRGWRNANLSVYLLARIPVKIACCTREDTRTHVSG